MKIAAIILMATVAGSLYASDAVCMLKGIEGFRATEYRDTGGKRTIGYGFTGRRQVAKRRYTEAEASAELRSICDGIAYRLRVEMGRGNELTAREEAAIVSFVYNVGWDKFLSSTMFRLLKGGKRGHVVANEFGKWVYVRKNGRKVISRGLVRRREKERRMFLQ